MRLFFESLFNCILVAVIVCSLFPTFENSVYAQAGKGITISGKVYNSVTKKAPDFANIVIVEAKVKAQTEADGSYKIAIPETGEYTVIVRSGGLKMVKTKIIIEGDMIRNFFLKPVTITGDAITITDERDIQKISRQTMSAQELKKVPGALGDSIGALASLPGVTRTEGFLGPLVIRGAEPSSNCYLIDDMPMFTPMHFGGLHSVVNNNIMSEIDLYSSSFPSEYGSANGALLTINTVDNVKKFGGYSDLSLLSVNTLVQMPILRDHEAAPASLNNKDNEEGTEQASAVNEAEGMGYIIASGRYGYFGFVVTAMSEPEMEITPEYWDYQAKIKYYFSKAHSITLLVLGSSDKMKQAKKGTIDNKEDPLMKTMQMQQDQMFHNQGLYYTYQPSKKFSNKLMAFSALQKNYMYFNADQEGVADIFRDYHIDTRPNIFGLKNKVKFDWLEDISELRAGIEYTYYHFKSHGKTVLPRVVLTADPDFSDASQFEVQSYDGLVTNHLIGGYIENKFTYEGLTLLPGIRSDYLKRAETASLDPRILASYIFDTDTTVSAAGGKYTYFFQVNPSLFIMNPNVSAIGKDLKTEKAYHRALGIEQKIDLFSIKIEGFNNKFFDLSRPYPHLEEDGTYSEGTNSGEIKTYGAEILIRKDKREDTNGLFCWISYTYTRSKYRSGLPTEDGYLGHQPDVANGDYYNIAADEYGDQWINFEWEMRHSLKLVAGYTFLDNHTLSGKFQLYSSIPYSPIIGANQDTNYTGLGNRYVPVYGKRNSEFFDPHHTLDLRYSYKTHFSWGHLSFYVEVINIYNNISKNVQIFDYRYDYSSNNPEITIDENAMFSGMMPNIGVEIKF